jgi:ankyrin repeat protein
MERTSHTRDSKGKTALLHAAEGGNLEVVQYLITSEGGASITEADDVGITALMLAAGAPSAGACYPAIVQ